MRGSEVLDARLPWVFFYSRRKTKAPTDRRLLIQKAIFRNGFLIFSSFKLKFARLKKIILSNNRIDLDLVPDCVQVPYQYQTSTGGHLIPGTDVGGNTDRINEIKVGIMCKLSVRYLFSMNCCKKTFPFVGNVIRKETYAIHGSS
jgi:hypothetical protein